MHLQPHAHLSRPSPSSSRHSHQLHSHSHPSPHPLNLQIPSLHSDALPLETTLHVPNYGQSAPFHRRAAIVAHPYAPLGGSLHDFVVARVSAALLSAGYVVATFNFRGAGRSKGRTTWTGKAEIGDYAAVAAWVISFMRNLPHPSVEDVLDDDEISLVVAGYSYGALIAANCPPVSDLLHALDSPPEKSFATAVSAAAKSARMWHDSHSESARTSYSGARPRLSVDVAASPATFPSRLPVEVKQVVVKYLLISPVLPPVALALMIPGMKGREKSAFDVEVAKERGRSMLTIWGGEDMFTGVKRYRKWKDKMEGDWDQFVGFEVEEAGHFWGDKDIGVLEAKVLEWAKSV